MSSTTTVSQLIERLKKLDHDAVVGIIVDGRYTESITLYEGYTDGKSFEHIDEVHHNEHVTETHSKKVICLYAYS